MFAWDKALNFESGSGPYHQYMHARANRILEEAHDTRAKPDTSSIDDYEFRLVKLISMAQRSQRRPARREGRM